MKRYHHATGLASAAIGLLAAMSLLRMTDVGAQLVECSQIDLGGRVDAPGGCIDKTLAEQIGNGHGDVSTPGSAVYLIKRDPARSIRRGRQLFQRKFTAAEGLGPRVTPNAAGDIVETRALGAGLSDSCAACHGRPRGSAGHGGDVATFPDSRDAPHLFGLGLIEMLADEMTADLRRIRDAAIAAAQDAPSAQALQTRGRQRGLVRGRERGFGEARQQRSSRNGTRGRRPGFDTQSIRNADGSVTRRLVSKGIEFGAITARPDGTLDTSGVMGVDEDLRVKPFFHDGRTASMRQFIIGAFNDEMGLQASDPVLCAVTDPDDPQTMISPAGFVFDPTEDEFARPPACEALSDPDGDGVFAEIDPALIDHLEFYLLNYFKPGQYAVSERARRGLRLMENIGCTSCHVKDLRIENDRRVADVETLYDPERGIFNDLYAEVYPLFGVTEDGDAYPQLLPLGQPYVIENIFTDLKRHNLGPGFHERDFDGSRIEMHVTEPLWGVGNSAPYGHDGRSVNLDAVIRRHSGEAARVTQAYERLSENDRDVIIDFLESLVLFPPDDTASNLNPGNPGGDLQLPADHGNINLGLLFQVPAEGGE